MKVEFANFHLGIIPNMIITAKEFFKARDDKEEMRLLQMATECYAAPNCIEYDISQQEYDYVSSWLKTGGKVVFAIASDTQRMHIWVEIYVINQSSIKKVRYRGDDKNFYIVENKMPEESK